MRIAVCITVYNSVRFLGKQFFYLNQLDPKPNIIYFIENNSTDGTVEYIKRNMPNTKIPYKIISYKLRKDAVAYFKAHGGTAYDVIAIARQVGLNALRRDECDFGIYIDDDLYMIEKDALKVLTSYTEDIIGGCYIRVYPEGIFVASKWGTLTPNKFMLKKYEKVIKPFDFPVITSGGCLCLSKRVIQDRRLNFYPVYEKEFNMAESASEDYGYCIKARKLGYKLILDNSTRLIHKYIETIQDVKPWTMTNGKYVDFKYT